jgi:DNA-binding ferritin-like protein (Dps family)
MNKNSDNYAFAVRKIAKTLFSVGVTTIEEAAPILVDAIGKIGDVRTEIESVHGEKFFAEMMG